MPKKVTIYDIAREAGVSAATVTRVLNGSSSVREATRLKVRGIIDAHGYAPSVGNLIARRLSGAFFIGSLDDVDRPDLREMLARLGKYMPIVAICPPRENLGFICMHNSLDSAVRQAVRHLHLLGHRRFAMIGGAVRLEDSGMRAVSFLDELKALDLPAPPEYGHLGGNSPEEGQREILRLMTALPREEQPTAVLCYNDLVALGALHQLRLMGFRVPEDVAVIGCDNQFFCPYTAPPLTSIDMQTEEHARSAVRELLATSENRSAIIVRDATLVIRESCGAKLGWRER